MDAEPFRHAGTIEAWRMGTGDADDTRTLSSAPPHCTPGEMQTQKMRTQDGVARNISFVCLLCLPAQNGVARNIADTRWRITDDNVRGVSDHGGRAAKVGEDGLGDEVGSGVHVDKLAQLAGDRANEQNGGHVVEERRQKGSHGAKQQEELSLVALGQLARQHTGPLEDTSAHGDADNKHHPPQETQGPMVHPPHHLREGGRAILEGQNDQAQGCSEHGGHRAMHHLRHDKSEQDTHDEPRDHHLCWHALGRSAHRSHAHPHAHAHAHYHQHAHAQGSQASRRERTPPLLAQHHTAVQYNMDATCTWHGKHLDRSTHRQKQKRLFSSISHAHARVERHHTCTRTHVARAQTHKHTRERGALGDHLISATPTEGVHGNGDGHRGRVLRDDDEVLVLRVVLDLELHQDGLLLVQDFIAPKPLLIDG